MHRENPRQPNVRRLIPFLVVLLFAPLAGAEEPIQLAKAPKSKASGKVGAKSSKDAKRRPSSSMRTRGKKRDKSSETETSIRTSIENQQQILELEEPDRNSPVSDYPAMLIALADFYWDLAEVYVKKSGSHKLEQAIFDAEEARDAKKLSKFRAQRQRLLDEQLQFQEKTVKTYKRVLEDFPKTKKVKLDEIRYFLGYHLTLMGKQLLERGQALQARVRDLAAKDKSLVDSSERGRAMET